MVLYCCCYTSHYTDEAKGLRESLEDHDLPHRIEEVPDRGSWDLNTKLKATYIQRVLREENCPVVWLDADARVMKTPDLFESIQADMACHIRRDVELLSGTLFFNPTEAAHRVIEKWIELNEKNVKVWDQRNLDQARKETDSLRFQKLPKEYCLFDIIVRQERCQPDDAVIWHRQASRRLKHRVNCRQN